MKMAPSLGHINFAGAAFILVLCFSSVSCDDPAPVQPNPSTSSSNIQYVSGPIEIVFSFDTTGSMYSVLQKVRESVAEMIHRLQSDIPGIRMAVLAHGDYEDCYVTEFEDMTTDAERLRKFVMEVEPTSGGDSPEAYEEVLRVTASDISWTPGSQRSLVMIGDAAPHEPQYYANKNHTDWRIEANKLAQMDVKIYSIKALNQRTQYFYQGIANMTNGYYLNLNRFDYIFDFIMAISYREYGLEYLEAYQEEVALRLGNIPSELARLFEALKMTAGQVSTAPSGQIIQRIPWQPLPTMPPLVPKAKLPKHMSVELLHIRSDIAFRFATTSITARLMNAANMSQEASFSFQLPKAAFISNFTMIIDGIEYPGEVKEKQQAKIEYEEAKEKGKAAAHITAVPKRTNSFKVAVNLPSNEDVSFELIYQELLERRMSFYDHRIHIDPGHPVEDFLVEVNIHETEELTSVQAQPIKDVTLNMVIDEDNPSVSLVQPAKNKANIRFAPSLQEQRSMSEYGYEGQFRVKYDVKRTQAAGQIEVMNGYFVHYFAPNDLPEVEKNIMFVLDMSGSMHGTKMRQLKDAMATILDQLQPGDNFNVMGFSSLFRYWIKEDMAPATPENVADAKQWVENMISIGATHISGALEKGLHIMNNMVARDPTNMATTYMVFLTDGQPTVGTRDPRVILHNVATKFNPNQFTIFSLGFGNDIDFPFLRELSLQTSGFARRIYADADATLQLQNFYAEIGSPVLSDVRLTYLDTEVETATLTRNTYKNYFRGSEIAICGVIDDRNIDQISSVVYGQSATGSWSQTLVVDVVQSQPEEIDRPSATAVLGNMERLWAYLTIRDILDKVILTKDPLDKEALNNRALELSLKYHFVTSLTSMVVVKPEEDAAEEAIEDTDEVVPENKTPGGTSTASAGESGTPGADGRSEADHAKRAPGAAIGPAGPAGPAGPVGPRGEMGEVGPMGPPGPAAMPDFAPPPLPAGTSSPGMRGESGRVGFPSGERGERGRVYPDEDYFPAPPRSSSGWTPRGSAGSCHKPRPRPPRPPVDPYPPIDPPGPIEPFPPAPYPHGDVIEPMPRTPETPHLPRETTPTTEKPSMTTQETKEEPPKEAQPTVDNQPNRIGQLKAGATVFRGTLLCFIAALLSALLI